MEAISVLVEGGGRLAGAFLEAGVVDRVVGFLAPVVLGGATAPGTVGGLGLPLPEGMPAGRRVDSPRRKRLGHRR
jgi:riboflavin biosynthesis pyrimidine reductase